METSTGRRCCRSEVAASTRHYARRSRTAGWPAKRRSSCVRIRSSSGAIINHKGKFVFSAYFSSTLLLVLFGLQLVSDKACVGALHRQELVMSTLSVFVCVSWIVD